MTSVGFSRIGVEGARQPAELIVAETAIGLAVDRAVEGDDAHRPIVDRIAKRPGRGQRFDVGKDRADQVAVVVIAGDRVDRTLDRAQHVRQGLVGLKVAVIGEIAGDQDDVGSWLQGLDRLDARRQMVMGVDLAE